VPLVLALQGLGIAAAALVLLLALGGRAHEARMQARV
jgi:hypothetical protein